MSFREEVMSATAATQRGLSIKEGDRFMRGATLVDVSKVMDGKIEWVEVSAGTTWLGPRRHFTGRALTRIPPPPADGAGTPAEAIWVLASAKQLSTIDRLRLLIQLYPDTVATGAGLNDSEAELVLGWIAALRGGQEPSGAPP